jgi:hypothetical protein
MNPLLTKLFSGASQTLLNVTKKPIEATTAKMVGAGVGALTGGVVGASSAQEGQKTKGFMVGAATGGLFGGFAGKTYAGFGQGGVDMARIKGLANELKVLSTSNTNAFALKGVGKYLSKNWATAEHLKEIPAATIQGPKNRAMFSITAKSPVQKIMEPQGSGVTRSIGNMARNFTAIADKSTAQSLGITGQNPVARVGQVLGREMKETMHHTKDGFRYKRSLPGKLVGAALGSGLGMGALEGATATNPDGSSAPIHKKIIKGTSSALGWGLASPYMGAKMLSYDLPRSIINPES